MVKWKIELNVEVSTLDIIVVFEFYAFDTCGDDSVATTMNYAEILRFRHFYNHTVFILDVINTDIKLYKNALPFL